MTARARRCATGARLSLSEQTPAGTSVTPLEREAIPELLATRFSLRASRSPQTAGSSSPTPDSRRAGSLADPPAGTAKVARHFRSGFPNRTISSASPGRLHTFASARRRGSSLHRCKTPDHRAAGVSFDSFETLGSTAGAQRVSLGWAWQNPVPPGRVARGVVRAGSLEYAIGDDGTLLRSSDGGADWSALDTGIDEPVSRLEVVDEATLVVGDESGCGTEISTNAGETFASIFNASRCLPVAAFSFVSPSVGFALLRDGAVERTVDGGGASPRRRRFPVPRSTHHG